MSDIIIGGWSDTWRTDLGYASVSFRLTRGGFTLVVKSEAGRARIPEVLVLSFATKIVEGSYHK